MPKKTAVVQIKEEENEIQSYINSFKEMEEPEGNNSGSKDCIEEAEIGESGPIEEGNQ